ncbi:MAG: hypothetical protein EBR67_06200 [Proteobacteria bacterium]|jgi:hypothetical protein|nr:hypothetical protein [Pseudomonadota bacterium]
MRTLEDETIKQSEFSPAVVDNNEVLLRTYSSPADIDDNSRFLDSSMSISDFRDRGLSCHRENYVNFNIMKDNAINRSARSTQRLRQEQSAAFAKIKCIQVRSLTDEYRERQLIVLDTALEKDNSHCSLFTLGERTDRELRKIRNQLFDLFYEYQLLS